MRVRTKAGQEIWLSVSTVLVPSQWGELYVLVHLFRDISHQKELERSVRHLVSIVEKLLMPRGTHPPTPLPAWTSSPALTAREREVLCLLASGAPAKAIAVKLGISPSTARNHINNILAKLGVHSRLEAVTLSMRSGQIDEVIARFPEVKRYRAVVTRQGNDDDMLLRVETHAREAPFGMTGALWDALRAAIKVRARVEYAPDATIPDGAKKILDQRTWI